MDDLLNSVDIAIESKNYYAALFIILTLPDICGEIQFPKKSSEKRYIGWFNQYMKDIYIGIPPRRIPFLTGEDLYSFRCSLLHEGSEDISNQRARHILHDFIIVENGPHLNLFNSEEHAVLQLSIVDLCKEMCHGVRSWLNDHKDDPILIEYKSRFVKIYPKGTIVGGIKFG
ncbi:MAG: hypothetical protein WAV76_10380 [Bacteroidota bacterium]